MDRNKLAQYRTALLGMIPADGSAVGNTTLRSKFQHSFSKDDVSEDDYWEVRKLLVNEGLIVRGRGKGGSVRLTSIDMKQHVDTDVVLVDQPTPRELELYEPFAKSLHDRFAKEEGLEDHITQVTALQGRRITGGKWTRPDVALIAVRSFEFVPGKHLELISFEVKPSIASVIEGVFEALAHSVFAHRSYLAVQVPDSHLSEDLARTSAECARHGVGLYTFTDASNFDTFDLLQDAVRRNPDPSKVNDFIATQLNSQNKATLKKWLR
jgi:hypothetical protein